MREEEGRRKWLGEIEGKGSCKHVKTIRIKRDKDKMKIKHRRKRGGEMKKKLVKQTVNTKEYSYKGKANSNRPLRPNGTVCGGYSTYLTVSGRG